MNITSSPRAGDADRDKVIEQLAGYVASGHLSQEEFTERRDRALKEETQRGLRRFMADLPQEPEPGPRRRRLPDFSHGARRGAFHSVAAVVTLAIAIIPQNIVVTGSHGIGNAHTGPLALGIFCIVAGAIGFIVNLIGAIAWAD